MGEFNVNKSTGGLEQTAGMPGEYPATQVMMPDGVTNVVEKMGNMRMTMLWENPSPTASFAAQNVTLSSGDYDYLMVVASMTTSSPRTVTTLTQKGKNGICSLTLASTVYSRTFDRTSDTQYSIAAGYNRETVDNSVIVPLIIYGIKLI